MGQQKHFLAGIILLFVGMAILMGGIYYYLSNYSILQLLKPTDTSVLPVSTSSKSVDIFAPTSQNTVQIIYRNHKYRFELIFPGRWQNYKVDEKDNVITFSLELKTPVKYDDGTIKKYHGLFYIASYVNNEWNEEIVSDDAHPHQEYLARDDNYVFTWGIGQDDEGYLGFPDVVANQPYYGPFSDVSSRIIPSFQFFK